MRADAELGAAWRRCEAVVPPDAHWGVERDGPLTGGPAKRYVAWAEEPDYLAWAGTTPTAALDALAAVLADRGGA